MSSPEPRSSDSRSASGWLGSGKKRRRSKDIRDYGELTIHTSKPKGTLLQSSHSNCDWDLDFVQPSLKEFLQSKSRKRTGSVPSKSSFSEGTIPASVFSAGVRRKVSPNNSTRSTSSSESPGIRNTSSMSERRLNASFKESLRALDQEEGQPSAKKRKRDKNGLARNHRHHKTCPPLTLASAKDKETSVLDRVPQVAIEDHGGGKGEKGHGQGILGEDNHERFNRNKFDEQDKENYDPKSKGGLKVTAESAGTCLGLAVKRCEGEKRRPLSEIATGKRRSACKNLINLMNVEEEKELESLSTLCDSRVDIEQATQRKTDFDGVMVDKKEDGIPPGSEGYSCQGLDETNKSLQLEELYMDTNELLAELSYCEKMSV